MDDFEADLWKQIYLERIRQQSSEWDARVSARAAVESWREDKAKLCEREVGE